MKQGKAMIVQSMLLAAALLLSACTTAENQASFTQERVYEQAVVAQTAFAFNSSVDTASYRASVSSAQNDQTYYDEQDIVDASRYRVVTIDLNQKEAVVQGVSASWSENGILTLANEGTEPVNYVLSGQMDGTVVINNEHGSYMVTFNGVQITGTTLPALQLASSEKAFLVLAEGSRNILRDTSNNSKKGVLTAAGDVIILGDGSLEASAYKKHALKIDGTLRILGGNVHLITTEHAEGNAISVDEAFIMDDGSLTIQADGSVYTEESKGIKVNGVEEEGNANGFAVINGGTLTITSVGKALTAGWDRDEDAQTVETSDDPTANVIINNGVVTLTTTGTPYEVSEEESLSPEGLEAKEHLIINGGLIQISATDDALNAGSSIQVNGGLLFAYSSQADGLDSNGTIEVQGGTIIALGSRAPETALDCDNDQNFSYSGGTIIALGGAANNTPLAQTSSGNVVTYGGALEAGTALALLNAQDEQLLAYSIPSYYTAGRALLIASDQLQEGLAYTLALGGQLADAPRFNGLALQRTAFTGGTQEELVISSTVTHTGEELRSMGFGFDRPQPPEGFEGTRPEPPDGFEPPMFKQ